MRRINLLINISILTNVLIFVVISYFEFEWAWGINHLLFLPDNFTYIYYFCIVIILIILFSSLKTNSLENVFQWFGEIFFKNKYVYRYLLIIFLIFIFILFRSKTFFLGDGYTWIGNFGNDKILIFKWTESLSIYLIRLIQNILNSTDSKTALLSFQIISIISGGVFIYNIVEVIKEICQNNNIRIFCFFSILLSGSIMLFFGYVEFYPALWAILSIFLNFSIKYLNNKSKIIGVIIIYLIAISIHAQTLFLILGFLFVITHKTLNVKKFIKYNKYVKYSLGCLLLIFPIAYYLLHENILSFSLTFLPLFSTKLSYYVFSPSHLLDILNLLFLLFPSLIIITSILIIYRAKFSKDNVFYFLLTLSIGSLSFLIFVDPKLGIGRDWDLMSFTLLPPFLLLFKGLDACANKIGIKTILCSIIICFISTSFFITINQNKNFSEKRFYTLLKSSGKKERNGWEILSNYYEKSGYIEKGKSIAYESEILFPEYSLHLKGFKYLQQGEISKAFQIAQHLIALDSNNTNYLNLLGQVYASKGDLIHAEKTLKKALKISPLDSGVLLSISQIYIALNQNDVALSNLSMAFKLNPRRETYATIGLVNFKLGKFERTTQICDTLLYDNPNSPEGHMLRMMIYLFKKNYESAKFHYLEYCKHGVGRQEYKSIIQKYKFLESK